jgi:hypothetical protein
MKPVHWTAKAEWFVARVRFPSSLLDNKGAKAMCDKAANAEAEAEAARFVHKQMRKLEIACWVVLALTAAALVISAYSNQW